MLFSQSPSLRALFFVVAVYDDPVAFCICWKICLKGNKNHNLHCPLKWIRVSSGCGRRGDSLPLPAGRFGAGLGTAAPRIFGMGGAAGPQESSSFPLGFPGAEPSVASCSHQEFPGARWGSRLSLDCRIQAWNFLLHQYWLE